MLGLLHHSLGSLGHWVWHHERKLTHAWHILLLHLLHHGHIHLGHLALEHLGHWHLALEHRGHLHLILEHLGLTLHHRTELLSK